MTTSSMIPQLYEMTSANQICGTGGFSGRTRCVGEGRSPSIRIDKDFMMAPLIASTSNTL